HVNVDGTFALACLAGKTKVERVFYVLVFPAAFQRIATQHFKEQARASTRGVLLFPGDHVAGAHGATIVFAALAHTDAAQGGFGKMSVVFREGKICFDRSGTVAGAEAEIFIER